MDPTFSHRGRDGRRNGKARAAEKDRVATLEAVGRATLIYDGDCGFCRWSTDRILRQDRRGRIRPITLQDPEAGRLLEGMDPPKRLESMHLVTIDGRVYSAGAAIPPLLRLLPGGRLLAALAAAFPRLTERLYRWVADHRDQLGRRLGAACSVDPRATGRSREQPTVSS